MNAKEFKKSLEKYNEQIMLVRNQLMAEIIETLPTIDPVKLAEESLKGNLRLYDIRDSVRLIASLSK